MGAFGKKVSPGPKEAIQCVKVNQTPPSHHPRTPYLEARGRNDPKYLPPYSASGSSGCCAYPVGLYLRAIEDGRLGHGGGESSCRSPAFLWLLYRDAVVSRQARRCRPQLHPCWAFLATWCSAAGSLQAQEPQEPERVSGAVSCHECRITLFPGQVHPGHLYVTDSERIVMMADIPTPEAAGHSFHILNRSGGMVSFARESESRRGLLRDR